ncbi:MAG TPA: M20/M25/M40 family metallo-hydrolase [Flavipsychrobacter sp.]|mgnify:CR=1 FL=1|nr:M20/M25/M40 family metallo-hydrolase [Flavipsychrobacter sp.]
MKFRSLLSLALLIFSTSSIAQDSAVFRRISNHIMQHGKCYEDLRVLCKSVGHRLSGSPQAQKAVAWGERTLREAGADKVWLQMVDVPHWVRGKESLKIKWAGKEWTTIPMLSLGNTVGTDNKVLEKEIVMVNSFDDFKRLSSKEVAGKIVFFNHRFPQELINTFEGYGEAGPYRWHGPNMASAKGAAAVIIRSISTGMDDAPHTGSLRYADSVKSIPAVAIGNFSADMLEEQCRKGTVRAQLQSNCKMLGTKTSFNVIGELKGSEYPDQFVIAGGHLDSWDVGEGAHDDGAGCVQSIEILRTFKRLNLRPKRTLRIVLFMNEENGLKGGLAYADSAKAKNEKHIFALESDAGGFSPRGIGLEMSWAHKQYLKGYRHLFLPYGVYDFEQEHGGADISPLKRQGVPVAGLIPDPQRYFDYHHTPQDVFEAVNHRELKLGAVAMTQLIYLIAQYGL